MKALKSLLTKTFIFSIVLGIITAGLKYTGIIPFIHDQWYFIILFYFALTGYVFYEILKSLQKEPRKFVFAFLIISVSRMMLFTVAILLYAFVIQTDNVQNVVSFILTFTAYYLLYTTWEVILMVAVIKNRKSNSNN